MANSFPRILSLLRKERGLSQKEAAAQLGISPALLSHYENGIRECGLDFLISAADFYRVSCDYLLGRSPDRTGALLKYQDLPDDSSDDSAGDIPQLNKKLIISSLSVIFDLLMQSRSHSLTHDCSMYLMTSVYRVLRILHAANPKNPNNMFASSAAMYRSSSEILMLMSETHAQSITSGGRLVSGADPEKTILSVSPEKLSQGYPLYAPALLNLIEIVEKQMGVIEKFSKEQNI